MTELGRDARALVARVKRQDGPSAADRVRMRRKLEPVWAAQRAESLAAAAEVAPRVGHGWMSWFSGLLLMSLGFVTPEVPRAMAPAAELAAAPAQAVHAAPAAAAIDDDSPREQPVVAQQIAAVEARSVEPAAAASRPQRRRVRARNGAALEAPQPAAASDVELEAPAIPAVSTEPPATREEARTRVQEAPTPAPTRPLAAVGGSTTLARGEQFAPNVSSHAFKAQPIDDELTWLSAAQEALRKNQPSSALRLVQEHAFRFPQGALASERVAVQALALCALSRKAAAREVLSDLEHRAPNSPLLARVRRNCGF
ncbi:MAG TPA: hypothetical protein VJV78_12615 [Polyangiales bacterium]|nr:hypothetical protein [Polyangiales bacterium]